MGISLKNRISKRKRRACSCCGFYTMVTGPGNHDVCPVCFWEDDGIQNDNPDFRGGANRVSLNEAKENYNEMGACEERFLQYVREPFFEEFPEDAFSDNEITPEDLLDEFWNEIDTSKDELL